MDGDWWRGSSQLVEAGERVHNRPPYLEFAAAPVASIAFDPESDTFATTGASDGLAKLSTTTTQQQFGAPLPGDPGLCRNCALHARRVDPYRCLSEAERGFVWPASLGAWRTSACAVAGPNFTIVEGLIF